MVIRLKTLELQGYKTYASQTVFEFANGITAVVGPNGSGKSNIVDAIRWVLGEQSFSVLRARKTIDLIFSGSELRARSGMAAVNITFDNSEGWLPVDFSEVNIVRRAYRDGQNEYLLNGQKVRLFDIKELLASAGLEQRTYTIVNQGLVDMALGLKADERRRLFEEAAGIGLYRNRKEEALRRLDTTRRNLDRVRDILSELQPRLNSLEKHAQKAKDYKQIQDDLRLLLLEWYGYHWHRSQEEFMATRKMAAKQRAIFDETRKNQRELEDQILLGREQNKALRLELREYLARVTTLQQQQESHKREFAVTEERHRALLERRQNMEVEITRLREKLAIRHDRVEKAEQSKQALQSDLDEASSRLAEVQREYEKRQEERSRLQEELEKIHAGQEETLTRRERLRAQLEEVHNRQRQLHIADQTNSNAIEQTRAMLQQAEDTLLHESKSLQQRRSHLERTEATVRSLEQELIKIEEDIRQVEVDRMGLQAELTRLGAQLEVLDQAEDTLAGYSQGAIHLLEVTEQAKISGVVGLLGSRLEVPEELELAISSALGVYLDAVVLRSRKQVEEVLDLLQTDSGRVAIIPLEDLVVQRRVKAPDDPDCIGVAAELVSVTQELRPAVDLLLNRVLVVRDKRAALRVLKKAEAPIWAVTLRGEVIDAAGPVLTGSDVQSSKLSRGREQRSIKTKVKAVADDLEKIVQTLTETKNERDDKQKALWKVRHENTDAQEAYRDAETSYQEAVLSAETARQQLGLLNGQKDQFAQDFARCDQEIYQLEKALEEVEEDNRQYRKGLEEKEILLNELTDQTLGEEVSDWETRAAVMEQAVRNAQEQLEDLRATVRLDDETLEAWVARSESISSDIQGLTERKEQLGVETDSMVEEVEKLQGQIAAHEELLSQAEAQQDELIERERNARRSLEASERQYTQVRIALDKRKADLDHLRQRIEDDFGLVEFEYADEVVGPKPLPLEGMVEQLPHVETITPDLERSLRQKRAQLHRMGAIYPDAQSEYEQVKQRFNFLTEQLTDLERAEADVKDVIRELDMLMEREFLSTFEAVAGEFSSIFKRLFGGGAAQLLLTNPDDLTSTGIEIEVRLPNRRPQDLSVLSGGERSLSAIALVFALLRFAPTPFCILDEVDAMLDDANIGRFRELLLELSNNTQIVIITHNRNTLRGADLIYGVSMGRDSSSQVISLNMEDIEEEKVGV
ncbi:MAG: chromosome segregation protein SMC [Chloroflexota bacterium]